MNPSLNKEQAKTAMSEMVEWLTLTSPDYLTVGLIRQRATELLEKEKEQITDAFSDGWYDGERYHAKLNVKHETAEDYYSKTYNQK